MSYSPHPQGTSQQPPTPAPSGPRPRTSVWIWVLLTLALLSLCSIAAMLVLATGGRLPDLSSGPEWTPPPLPTVPLQPERSADLPFLPGDSVVIVSAGAVNLRQTPGFQNKPASDVLRAVPGGTAGTVVAGPQTADGLTWWQVRFDGLEGWMADRTGSGVVLLDLVR